MDVKSVIAVLGGLVLMYFLSEILEPPLVMQLASERPANLEALLVARYEQTALIGRLVLTGFIGLLAGYVVAKIAGQHELPHAAVSAAMQGFITVRTFAADPHAAAVPLSMRAAFVAVTAAAMLAGALIRARAARLAPPTEVRS